jgi:hypothetical protein
MMGAYRGYSRIEKKKFASHLAICFIFSPSSSHIAVIFVILWNNSPDMPELQLGVLKFNGRSHFCRQIPLLECEI